MKTSLFFLTSMMSAVFSGLYAQDFTTSKNVLLDMRSGAKQEVLDDLDNYKPFTDREKQRLYANVDSLRSNIQRYAWGIFQAELAKQKNIKIPDKEALKEYDVQYTRNGFPSILIPKTVIKKLTKLGCPADYYFSLGVNVEMRSQFSVFNEKVKPTINCDIKVFSPDREIIKELDHRLKSEEIINSSDISGSTFSKMSYRHILLLVDVLKPMIEQAIKETVEQM